MKPAAKLSVNASLTLTSSFYKAVQCDRDCCLFLNWANSAQAYIEITLNKMLSTH